MTIAILGATGTTGRQIARILDKKSADLILCGRDQARLHSLVQELSKPCLTSLVDANDSDALTRIARDSKVIVNCIGPFTLMGRPVVEAAIASGCDYLDICGEQGFIKTIIEDFGDKAKQACSTLIPACAFEYALGDTAAALIADTLGDLDELQVVYEFEDISVSPGTRKSVICALEAKAYQLVDNNLYPIEKGQVESMTNSSKKRGSRFPFPGGEVFMVPLHSKAKTIRTYLTSSMPGMLLRMASKTGPALASLFKAVLLPLIDMTGSNPNESMQEKTSFIITITGITGNTSTMLRIQGKNPYALTAAIAAETALALHLNGSALKGVISPSMAFGPQKIKSISENLGVAWVTN